MGNLKKMSVDNKKQIKAGAIGFWGLSIGISLLISAVTQIVQSILGIVQVANQSSAEGEGTKSNNYSYSPFYSKSNAFVRISKYPSKTNINYSI